jgi:DNA mismatch repair protein MutL
MADIRRLDEVTVERIAAGEVVERPASVVKELVENSLDADASRVDVAVEAGGSAGIRVTDDGLGMTEDEVRRAVEQHTTSKIRDIDDLAAGVGTLGFRGEALHAIGTVSRLTVRTRPRADRDVADRGTELTVEGGEVTSVDPAGCPEGTTVSVEDLFYNVPARRKYLKQDATEFAHVNTVVASYALANPEVAVSLSHDGRETFATVGSGDLRQSVMAVYGREVAESMVAVDARPESGLPGGPLASVSGLVSHPETTRASREYVSTYVNDRYVTASAIRDAAVQAYGAQLAPDRFPFAVLFLEIPAGDVDVNVHPRKLDVRFADESAVRGQVRSAVEAALLEAGLLRSSAPRGQSAPEQAEIDPELATGTDSDPADATAKTDGDDENAGGSTSAPDTGTGGSANNERSPAENAGGGDSSGAGSTVSAPGGADVSATRPADEDVGAARDEPGTGDRQGSGARRKFSGGHKQQRVAADRDLATSFGSLPSMRILGQFRDTYVVSETADGLVLVDQHAADERINYERLQAAFAGDVTTQVLAAPVDLSLTAREAELFEQFEDALATLGFRAERTDERTVTIRTVPSLVAEAADPDLLRDALGAFVRGEGAAAETVEAAADELLADLACYPSVTGNTSLTDGSVRELLQTLDDCDNPWACPHGRPVLVEFEAEEIDARFERDYPGHGGRRE